MPDNKGSENWDLDQVISPSDQAEVKNITLATRSKAWFKFKDNNPLRCRVGIHKYSSWNQVTSMAFQAMNEGTGESVRHDFEVAMRCCFKCGRPCVKLRSI